MQHAVSPFLYAVRITAMLTALAGKALLAPATAQVGVAQNYQHVRSAQVPFVGCKSDGQVGPLKAPKGHSRTVSIPAEAAQRLAYYKGEDGPGVLAPRGWYCFETYGSSGSSLYVSPTPLNSAIVFADKWKGLSGAAIQLSVSIGDTSGRFEVASIIARVFPQHKAFVRKVIAEGIEPASDFHFGPYPNDKLTYKNKTLVEYQTPPQTEGLGTDSRLQKNLDSISGVEILTGEELSLISLAVRVPSNMGDLTTTIIQQVEREVAKNREGR
jgi:hypothetical protein